MNFFRNLTRAFSANGVGVEVVHISANTMPKHDVSKKQHRSEVGAIAIGAKLPSLFSCSFLLAPTYTTLVPTLLVPNRGV
jgi:hypothetical protein